MTKFESGDRVRSDNNPEGGVGTVLAWNDPRCAFAPEDWVDHSVVAWADSSVTIVADRALSLDASVDWEREAREPEE
jgi:hypothetical protein